MTYLIYQEDNGNFVGIASCDIDNHQELKRPIIFDFHWDKDAKSVADFIFKHFGKNIHEIRWIDNPKCRNTIKTF